MRIVVRSLSKTYGHLWALRDINLEIRGAEWVALLGPNGAGKTTLLRLLAGVLSPTAGAVEIDGGKFPEPSLRSRVGFLVPDGHFYENLTVKENLRLFSSLYGKPKSEAEIGRVLGSMGLDRWAGDCVSALSSGMRCRLALAKWVLLEPGLLLLDEPYGVLDGSGVDLLEGHLRGFCRRGGAVVIATHQLGRVLETCTRAVVLNQGRLIFDGPRTEPWNGLRGAVEAFLPHGEKWSF